MRLIVASIFAALLSFSMHFGSIALGQGSAPASPRAESLQLSNAGSGLYRPDHWGIIRVGLKNSLDHDIELLACTHFQEDATLQYSRAVWLPARSHVTTWHPIKVPPIPEKAERISTSLRTQALSIVNGSEVMATNDFGAMLSEQSLMLARNELSTAIFIEPSQLTPDSLDWSDPATAIRTLRYERRLKYNFATITDSPGASGEEMLDALDHIIVADDRLKSDLATISAIRRWVTSGGQMWIMADRISPELLHLLLGDECTVTEVDRVDLTEVRIESSPTVVSKMEFQRSDLHRPASFVRLITDDFNIHFVVDGWPAAFWKPYGQGRILVTTLDMNAWIRPRQRRDPVSPDGASYQTNFVAGPPLGELAFDFFTPRAEPSIKRKSAEEYVRQLIGYTVPSRLLVLGTLVMFSLAIVAIGIWLNYRGKVEQLIAIVPVLSVVASGILLIFGWRSRSSVPMTVAVLQQVQSVPGTDDIRTSGVAAIISSDSKTAHLHGERGGWMFPETSGMQGYTRRLVWTDLDQWSWEKLVSPPGLRMVAFQSEGIADLPLTAVGRLEPSGIKGKLNINAVLMPTDAVIATSRGRLGVRIRRDGEFICDPEPLAKSEYLSSAVLSDEQQRRNRLMPHVLQPQKGIQVPSVPTMYVWTAPWKAGMSLTRRIDMNGSGLLSVPMHWQRPSTSGAPVHIPSPLLPYREVTGPDDQRPAGIYDYRKNVWVQRTGHSTAWLAFQLPKALLPLNVKSATLTLMVLGPMGKLKVSAFDGSSVRIVKEWDAPVGTMTIQIDDKDLLNLDSQGRLLIRIDAGISHNDPNVSPETVTSINRPRGSSDPASYWQFEDVSLAVKAEIPPSKSIQVHSQDPNP